MRKNTVKPMLFLLITLISVSISCNTVKQKDLANGSKPNQSIPRKTSTAAAINHTKTKTTTTTTTTSISYTKTTTTAISHTKVTPSVSLAHKHNKTKRKHIKKDVIISQFKTQILDMDKHRIFNITKASKRINHYKLVPNAIFSFNKVVGERDSEKGYEEAKIIVKGKREVATGGGICQLSSTIYNAIFPLKLPIIERHNHTGAVHYLPQGKDAAVDYGNLDFKFENTFDFPIRFNVYIKKGYLHVQVIKVSK